MGRAYRYGNAIGIGLIGADGRPYRYPPQDCVSGLLICLGGFFFGASMFINRIDAILILPENGRSSRAAIMRLNRNDSSRRWPRRLDSLAFALLVCSSLRVWRSGCYFRLIAAVATTIRRWWPRSPRSGCKLRITPSSTRRSRRWADLCGSYEIVYLSSSISYPVRNILGAQRPSKPVARGTAAPHP